MAAAGGTERDAKFAGTHGCGQSQRWNIYDQTLESSVRLIELNGWT